MRHLIPLNEGLALAQKTEAARKIASSATASLTRADAVAVLAAFGGAVLSGSDGDLLESDCVQLSGALDPLAGDWGAPDLGFGEEAAHAARLLCLTPSPKMSERLASELRHMIEQSSGDARRCRFMLSLLLSLSASPWREEMVSRIEQIRPR